MRRPPQGSRAPGLEGGRGTGDGAGEREGGEEGEGVMAFRLQWKMQLGRRRGRDGDGDRMVGMAVFRKQ